MILSRLSDRGVEQILQPYDLSIPEFDMLAVLRRCGPPFRQSVGELRAHSLLSSGAMTNRVDRLEQKGLVQCEPNPEDRRGVLVVLTKKGRVLIDQVVPERLKEGHGACVRALQEGPPTARGVTHALLGCAFNRVRVMRSNSQSSPPKVVSSTTKTLASLTKVYGRLASLISTQEPPPLPAGP